MRAIDRMRRLEAMTLGVAANYVVDYTYDNKGRVSQEIVTGDINKTTTYTYDDATDNIITETTVENGITITKTYEYDEASGNIVKVTVVKS
jgi:hypothetical protein